MLYEAGVRLKLFCYNAGLVPRTKLDCCVISIGNITVGGTGKTPTAQKVALMIQKLGYRVVILNRGYRSHWEEKIGVVSDGKKIYMTAYEAGDEAFLMAKQLPGIPVVIGKERAITGQFAVDKFKAEVIILMTATSTGSCTGTWTWCWWIPSTCSATAASCPGARSGSPSAT